MYRNYLEPNKKYVNQPKPNKELKVSSVIDKEFLKINDYVWDEIIEQIKHPKDIKK
jgi:hypothetical protein